MLGASFNAIDVTARKCKLMLLLVGGDVTTWWWLSTCTMNGRTVKIFLQFFSYVFCWRKELGGLVLVSTGENYTLMALVRDNAALPVF